MEKKTKNDWMPGRKTGIAKRFLAMVIAIVMIVTMAPQSLLENMGVKTDVQAASDLSLVRNPRIKEELNLDSEQMVTYDCVYFGSYPQTEIVDRPETSGCYDRVWVSPDDYEVNTTLYTSLKNASYNLLGYTTIGDVKYQRVSASTAQYSKENSPYYYNWNNTIDKYHYFRYEPIKWRVLKVQNGQAMLMSDLALDTRGFDVDSDSKGWSASTLRSWLNGYDASLNSSGGDYKSDNFMKTAFTTAEQAGIFNERTGYDYTGTSMFDRVYLLTQAQTSTEVGAPYGFVTTGYDEAKQAKASAYAKAMGAYVYAGEETLRHGNIYWWTRTSTETKTKSIPVTCMGALNTSGEYVTTPDNTIRPVITLNLSNTAWTNAGTYSTDGTVSYGDYPVSNPVVLKSNDTKSGQNVKYDCIWMGSYPQTEIVDVASTCGTYGNTYWGKTSDYEVNTNLYNSLKNATAWDSKGDIMLAGVRYRRLRIDDTEYVDNNTNHYRWQNQSENPAAKIYHYFRYEPVKWRVLKVNPDGTALLHSDIALDCKAYESSGRSVYWASSEIRSWLNTNFYDAAFNAQEKNAILKSKIINNNNIEEGTYGGAAYTEDRIFLLSEAEVYSHPAKAYGFAVNQYTTDEERERNCSTYAKARGSWMRASTNASYNGNVIWWLRSPGDSEVYNAVVGAEGAVSASGDQVGDKQDSVCPALVINLNAKDSYGYAGYQWTNGTKEEIIPDMGISISKTSLYLPCGQSYKLTATVVPANAQNKSVLWGNLDPYVATVSDDGTVKAIKRGTTTIVAKSNSGNTAICKVTVGFSDVAANAWYLEPVNWAVEKGITNGKNATTFAPDEVCTRAEVVAFLWNAAGKPKPTRSTNPFKDVKSTDWFYTPVLWAVEKGITNGKNATTFAPNETCTRAQVVTFLWNSAGKKNTTNTIAFTDVPKTAYYYQAVRWAVYEKVTNGKNATTFAPDEDCTRAQVVTFLWNYMKK